MIETEFGSPCGLIVHFLSSTKLRDEGRGTKKLHKLVKKATSSKCVKRGVKSNPNSNRNTNSSQYASQLPLCTGRTHIADGFTGHRGAGVCSVHPFAWYCCIHKQETDLPPLLLFISTYTVHEASG